MSAKGIIDSRLINERRGMVGEMIGDMIWITWSAIKYKKNRYDIK